MNAAEAEALLPVTYEFLDTLLRMDLRTVAFDCDGTLWAGDAGERFFDWELRQGDIVPDVPVASMRERYAAYKRGEVDQTTMCGEMVTMHCGISELKIMAAAIPFFDRFFVPQIFPNTRQLVPPLPKARRALSPVSSPTAPAIRPP